MNNTQTPKKVMPEDIDYEIVTTICRAINNSSKYNQANLSAWDVKRILAYLANNPIDLTPEAQGSITKEWDTTNHDWTNYVKFIADRTQRSAFLKKEEELPEEVEALLFDGATSDADYYNKANQRIRAAWKIGAGIK